MLSMRAQRLLSCAGRINGKLRLVSNDVESWRFPVIKGRLRGHDLGFHFFDAPDDFSKTKLDLLFEGDRLYMHGAQGFFGAVPLTLTGISSLCLFILTDGNLWGRCIQSNMDLILANQRSAKQAQAGCSKGKPWEDI